MLPTGALWALDHTERRGPDFLTVMPVAGGLSPRPSVQGRRPAGGSTIVMRATL